MALLSEARFDVRDPTVQLPDNRLIPRGDTTTAQAIEAFGKIGGEIQQGIMKGQLKNDLQDAGNIISSINAGYPQLQEDIESGRINPDTDQFYRLSLAAEQGKISEQRAQLEAEVLLRSKIAQAPGFADEFRRTAQEALGFDPTGAALNQLFLSGPDASSTRLTQEQEDIEQAQAMVSGGVVANVQEGVRLINEARISELRQTTTSAAIRNGKINSGKIAVEAANRVSDSASPILLQAMQQVRELGGVEDIESLTNSIRASTQLQIRQIENEMSQSEEYVYEPDAYNTMRTRALETQDAVIQILENQDMMKILSRRSDILDTTANIGLFQIAPELAIISGLGEAAISSYLDLSVLAQNDPRKRAELIKRNPNFAWIAEVDSLVSQDIAKSLKARADGTLAARIATGELDKDTARATLRTEAQNAANGQVTPEEFDQIIGTAMRAEMPKTAISAIAQNPASYSNLSEENRQVAVANIRQEQQRQVNSIAQGLASQGYQLAFKDGQFRVVDPQGRSLSELDPLSDIVGGMATLPGMPGRARFESDRLASQVGVVDQVNYLNKQLLPIMQNVQWANEAGFGHTGQWANRIVTDANSNALAQTPSEGEMDFERFMSLEGSIPTYEPDPAGNLTIGFGHKGDISQADRRVLGIDPNTPMENIELNDEQQRQLLELDVQRVYPRLQSAIPRWDSLERPARKAFIDMAFHMGVGGVQGFKNTLKALREGDREKFVEEFQDSNYFRGWAKGPDGKIITDENGEPKVFRGIQRRAQENLNLILEGASGLWQASEE